MNSVISRSYMRTLFLEGFISFNYENLLEKHYKCWIKSGDCVIDVGAHDGRHTEKFHHLVGKGGAVLAFEPIPEKFKRLQQRFSATGVSLVNAALSDESGIAEFIVSEGALEESGLRQRIYNHPDIVRPKKIAVSLRRLDEFENTLDGLSFIKIDIEGAEINCLRGATKIINRFRPLISIEYGEPSYSVYGNTKWSLFDFCKEQGYVLYDVFLNRLNTRNKWAETVDSICWDYFMVPLEKESLFIKNVINTERLGYSETLPLIFEKSLSKKCQNSVVLLQGFSHQEDWGVWTESRDAIAKIEFADPPENDLMLLIQAHGFVPNIGQTLKVLISAGDFSLGEVDFSHSEQTPIAKDFYFTIPLEAVQGHNISIKFNITDPRSPADFGLSSDTRVLGLGLRKIAIFEKLQ